MERIAGLGGVLVKAFHSGFSAWPSPTSKQTGARLRLCAGRQQQFSPTEKQIDQRASDKQPVRVLLQSSVAQLHKSELQLHHLKHMLHLGTHARFGSVLRPLEFVNLILVPVATMSVVLRARCALLNYMALSLISLITQTRVSSPCSRSESTVESATFAAVATAVWMILLLLSTPTWAFMPKYH